MLIAMVAVRMMQFSVHEVIHVIAVWHRLVTAARSMPVICAVHIRGATHRIGRADRHHMFVDVILVHVVQMAVVKIVVMAVVAHCGVPAAWAMLVAVVEVVRQVT
jgi:hypothetical protein